VVTVAAVAADDANSKTIPGTKLSLC